MIKCVYLSQLSWLEYHNQLIFISDCNIWNISGTLHCAANHLSDWHRSQPCDCSTGKSGIPCVGFTTLQLFCLKPSISDNLISSWIMYGVQYMFYINRSFILKTGAAVLRVGSNSERRGLAITWRTVDCKRYRLDCFIGYHMEQVSCMSGVKHFSLVWQSARSGI